MPSTSRVPSMAAFSLALPTAARWLRPKGASPSLSSENAGGLAQGPEEKRGLAGRVAGCSIAIFATLPDKRPSLGRGVPPRGIRPALYFRKCRNDIQRRFGGKIRRMVATIGNLGEGSGGAWSLFARRPLEPPADLRYAADALKTRG